MNDLARVILTIFGMTVAWFLGMMLMGSDAGTLEGAILAVAIGVVGTLILRRPAKKRRS